ncbi:HAD-IA family hydrolase [Lichenicoccus roseus]|uniref:phosphoglycolate phosphatase n=1 Tax=Lichenicoccus roseus TaxID=2683649 RepID=A0A5R9JB08_9PROT|nr:HAD-IA family hydrolase [Lichenicoccus roseus]TLU72566.1 HAD family hydrolase [Lichenicoccus roseus]
MTAPRLVVFDLDGTLVDTLDDLTACANRLLGRLGADRRLVAGEVRPMVGDGVPALVRRVLRRAGLAEVDETAAIAGFATDYEQRAAEASRAYPGATETLDALRRDGWRLAVCTNKPEAAARHLLTALGMADYLDAIGGGDSFPARKPDPAHLLGTIEQAGGVPARSVMVGDHRNDIEAARGAGVASIFAGWGFGSEAMAQGSRARAGALPEIPALAAAMIRE